MTEFVHRQKVLFQHCDPAGIVFYPRYFEMVNATVETWFDAALGHAFERMHGEMDAAVPTARIEATFSAPSRHGDLLDFALRLERLGRSSADIAIAARCGAQTRLRLTATLVFVRKAAMRSAPWPPPLAAALRRALDGANAEA